MTNKPFPPPSHLSAAAQALWTATVRDYSIDEMASAILRTGLEAYDRQQEARTAIANEGAVIRDRWNVPKVSPWVAVERDAGMTLCRCFRLLGCDLHQTGEASGTRS